MYKTFIEFTDLFSKLTPYDLDHLSETLLCKIEEAFDGELRARHCKIALTERDIKDALTKAMRDIALDMRERQISSDHRALDETRVKMFSRRNLAA